MNTRTCLLIAATMCVAIPASSQLPSGGSGYAVKKCDDPKVPIGALSEGSGSVSYLLGKDGKPDTASIAVLNVVGLSAAGFRSVAVRKLSACRFDMGRPEPRVPASVVSDITFTDSLMVQIGAATPASAPGTPLAVEPQTIPKDSLPLPLNDSRIEERPLRLSCPAIRAPAPPPPPVMGGRMTRAQAQAQQDTLDLIARQQQVQQQARSAFYSGTLVAKVLVGIDGKPGSQVTVIKVSNPTAAQNLAEMIGGCRFAPARIHGIAVPAYIVTRVP